MTYQELQDILRRNQLGQGVPVAPSLDQIISGIQGQYQPFAQQPLVQGGQGAQRFVTGPQAFEQAAFTPVAQSAPAFTPGAFNIEQFRYKEPEVVAPPMGESSGGDSYFSQQPDSNVENFGNPLSLNSLMSILGATLSLNPLAAARAVMNVKNDMGSGTYGTVTTNPDGSKTISGKISGQPYSYTEAGQSIDYGTSPTAVGAPTADQAAQQANALADALSAIAVSTEAIGGSSDFGGYSDYGGGYGGVDSGGYSGDGAGGYY